MAKKQNWSKIKNVDYIDTAQGRDVYNEQQLGRGKLQEKQTMTSRLIIAIVLSLLVGFLVYITWKIVTDARSKLNQAENVCEVHQDINDDDICDICGMHDLSTLPADKVLTTHVDADGDTRCDKCGVHFAHQDINGDHLCDYDYNSGTVHTSDDTNSNFCGHCVHEFEDGSDTCKYCGESRKNANEEKIGVHDGNEDAAASGSSSSSSSSGSTTGVGPNGYVERDYNMWTHLFTDEEGHYWTADGILTDAEGNPLPDQVIPVKPDDSSESTETNVTPASVPTADGANQVEYQKAELSNETVQNEDGTSDLNYKDASGNVYRHEHLDSDGAVISAEEYAPILNRETGDLIYHGTITRKEFYENGKLTKIEYYTPAIKRDSDDNTYYDPYLYKFESYGLYMGEDGVESVVRTELKTRAKDSKLNYLDTALRTKNSSGKFNESYRLVEVDNYKDDDFEMSGRMVSSELYTTVNDGNGNQIDIKHKVAIYGTTLDGNAYVKELEFYSANNINTHTQFLNENQRVTNDDYWRYGTGERTVKKRDVWNPDKDKLIKTEYYDDEGNITEVVMHHGFLYPVSAMQVMVSVAITGLMFLCLYEVFKKNLIAQNMLADTEDINQYSNDQHIALPEEIQRKYDWFPDVGAHSSVLVSSMISHMALKNKGVNKVFVAKRYKNDVIDENGEIIYYKGEIEYDDDGNAILEERPMFDEEFADALFEASNAPKEIRFSYDVTQIPYNPDNGNREKLQGKEPSSSFKDKMMLTIFKKQLPMVSKYDTVADLINKDWFIPEYEPQRPAGAYIVDTAPVNTMVLAITRAGKGQTVIEPTIDMWTREKRGNNMVINDPKGELLVKFYVRGTFRGYQIVQFNLINAMKTDIYNPLGMAAQSAREGDFTKCAMYVENIAEVFFPLDGGDDPVWPNAANNAFKRAAYGLIDYYLEEERKYRNECNALIAKGKYIDPQVIETNIDQMWGKVTLYNCYQMFTQLTSKKITNPAKEFAQKMKSGGFEGVPEEEIAAEAERVNILSDLWNGAPEADCLTLYFSATEKLPNNSMRTLVSNVNNALKAMAGAEKMMASVYGIAITAMSFFTDPTISTLTSGTPSQTVDLAGFSFPRRFGVRFHPDYIARNHYTGLRCKWDAFEDKEFTKPLGKLFEHSDIVSREGWARYYFDGKFESNTAYVRLRLFNASTDVLVHTYYFEFHKGYHTSLDGRTYVKDPLLGTKIAKNGTIREFIPKGGKYVPGSTTFKRKHLSPIEDNSKDVHYTLEDEVIPCITQSYVRYAEKPKMCFLVTPPHLMKYAKLILILIKQLVDLNFDQSYMTKENQKPLYKTRFMLDELGNLQSEGHGISGFETMLSIGLGQEQQFTLILQTLQQLKDVYGDSVDKIVQGNTSNIVFLKSTDDSMLETLQKMSGTTHKSYIDQKTVTRDMEKLVLANEGKASYMMQTKEVPVISYNDMAFIAERNSIVFRAGDSPIWNKNETILPMSWRLFSNTIKVPGKDFSLQTIPTLSSAVDFDLKKNQPDFDSLLKLRMEQAIRVDAAISSYKANFDYDDDDIHRLDIDVYAGDIMDMINNQLYREGHRIDDGEDEPDFEDFDDCDFNDDDWFTPVENEEVKQEVDKCANEKSERDTKCYAHNTISKSELVNKTGVATHYFDNDIIMVYKDIMGAMNRDTSTFMYANGCLCSTDGAVVYIQKVSQADVEVLAAAAKDANSNVYSDEEITETDMQQFSSWIVTDEFYQFLADLPNWSIIANGKFEEAMARRMMMRDN